MAIPTTAADRTQPLSPRLRRCERTIEGLIEGMGALRKEIDRLERENAWLGDELERVRSLAAGADARHHHARRRS